MLRSMLRTMFALPLLWVESRNSPGPLGLGPWGRWLVVLDGSFRCYGGQPIVLRLWISFLLCWSIRRIGFSIVPDARQELRTLGTGCLVGLRGVGTGAKLAGMRNTGRACFQHACSLHSFLPTRT